MSRSLLFVNFARSFQKAALTRTIFVSTPRRNNDGFPESESPADSESRSNEASSSMMGRRRNFIRFAGLAEDDCEDDAIRLWHARRLSIKVVATNERMKEAIKHVKKDMNVAVQGTLVQKNIISERDGRFSYVKSDYIKPEKIEIITSDEEVERKYRERPSLSSDF